jgi:C4-type Zn-finger protein
MKLIEKISQSRRDFQGKYECQGCGHIEEEKGKYSYDDNYFHDNVIPKMKCAKCGKSTLDLGVENERLSTKYPDGFQI